MVLIFGGSGNIGQSIQKLFTQHRVNFVAPSSKEVDATNRYAVNTYVSNVHPISILNLAAHTGVDWCEDNQEKARWINAYAVENIGWAARKNKSRFVHVSTDYVFSGKNNMPYDELDPTIPVQEYGRSKLLGEKLALDVNGLVVRVQWVIGEEKSSFVTWIVDSLKTQAPINLSSIQYGSPCSAAYIAMNLFFLVAVTNSKEIIHVSHDDYVNRYDLGVYIAQKMGLKHEGILNPVTHANFGKAERPVNTRLSNAKIKRLFSEHFNPNDKWQTDIDQFLERKYGVK